MADLYQSEYDEIKVRRGVQDLDNLIALIDLDGSIHVVEDPTEDEIRAAREKAAADAQAAQEEAEAAAEEEEAAKEEEQAKLAEQTKTARTAGFPLPEDNPPPAVEGGEEPPEVDNTLPPEGEEVVDEPQTRGKAGSKK